MATLLLAEQVFTPLDAIHNGAILIEGSTIVAVGDRTCIDLPANTKTIDFGNAVLAPGLIDLHVHGGAGHDVMEASDSSLSVIERHMARHGVTSYCPTTVTAPITKTLDSLNGLATNIESSSKHDATRARPLGIHLEGPFLSHAKRGVHPPSLLQPASIELFERMWQAATGHINLLTIAPEIEGAIDLISQATRRGIRVSLGHSDADLAQAQAGIATGARHATHTFNAMRALDHRQPGLLGPVLTDNSLTADIIVDGIHVDPVVVNLFVRAKGIAGAVLITDAISATGMPDGTYTLGDLVVQVREGRCESGGRLAGSVLTLDRAVRNTTQFANIPLLHAIRMASFNPARVLGLESRKGLLAPGADADITAFTNSGEVRQTIIGGLIT